MSIQEIKNLILERNLVKALQLVELHEKDYDIGDDQYFIYRSLKCQIYKELDRYEEALLLISNVLGETSQFDKPLFVFNLLITKAEILMILGRTGEGSSNISKCEQLMPRLAKEISNENFETKKAQLLKFKGLLFSQTSDYKQALNCTEQSLALFEKQGKKQDIAELLSNLGEIYYHKSEQIKAMKFQKQSLNIREELGNKADIADSLKKIGNIHYMKRELGKTLEFYLLGYNYLKQTDHKTKTASILNNIAAVYAKLGNMKRALEKYNQALVLLENTGNSQVRGVILNNLGKNHRFKGELNKALEYYLESYRTFKEIGNELTIGSAIQNIGEVYTKMGELEKGLDYLKQSLIWKKKVGTSVIISNILLKLISTTILNKEYDQAEEYLSELQTINKQEKNILIDQRTRVGKALILKMSPRIKNRLQAITILETIVEEDVIDTELTVESMLHLCELLLTELQLTENQEAFTQVKSVISRLFEIAKNQESYWLIAESYWLQSQLALLELNIDEAKRLLIQAQLIADEWGMNRIAEKISNYYDKLLKQSDIWENLVKREASLKECLETSQMTELIAQIIGGNFDISESLTEEPIMLLILKQSGQPIFSMNFVTDKEFPDETLISGSITAINMFLKEAFSTSNSFERIKHEEYTIVLRSVGSLLFCYILKGQSYTALNKLDTFIETIQDKPADLRNELEELLTSSRVINNVYEESIKKLANQIFTFKVQSSKTIS